MFQMIIFQHCNLVVAQRREGLFLTEVTSPQFGCVAVFEEYAGADG